MITIRNRISNLVLAHLLTFEGLSMRESEIVHEPIFKSALELSFLPINYFEEKFKDILDSRRINHISLLLL